MACPPVSRRAEARGYGEARTASTAYTDAAGRRLRRKAAPSHTRRGRPSAYGGRRRRARAHAAAQAHPKPRSGVAFQAILATPDAASTAKVSPTALPVTTLVSLVTRFGRSGWRLAINCCIGGYGAIKAAAGC